MEIKVLGTGCETCKMLYKQVSEIIEELDLGANLEKVDDIPLIISYGVMSVPALVINDKVIFAGTKPSRAELVKYLTDNKK